jgi:glyoxylase-like metal-dependent hydrolase (beta-lactamase superfamily II)
VDGEWVPTFPNARYLFGKQEYEHWKMLEETKGYHDLNHMADAVQPVLDAGLVDLIEIDYKPCPEITLRPTPGHTPGHVSINIESNGEKAIITGDLMHCPIQLEEPQRIVRFDMDQAQGAKTRQDFVNDLANSETLVIGSHFSDPSAGYVISDNEGCRLRSNKN